MTGARQRRKAWRLATIVAAGAALLGVAARGGPDLARAATATRVVADSRTGLALSGFDPVAYFTDGKPRLGEGGYEAIYLGAVWRFSNEGNKAAFSRDPEVYAPRFGGYDPIALERGVAVAGHPLIWLISGDRLYLFSDLNNRRRFAADAQRSIAAAEHHWPEVAATLVP
jgi:hypothetical protein